MLEQIHSDRIPRRAFLIMPFAFAGLVAISRHKETLVPDASVGGSGDQVELALFSDKGVPLGTERLGRVVKSESEWRKQLASEEFSVARRGGTEIAYTGRYWNTHERGLYRCICCGNALFRSDEKFDSGTGWPSFWNPIAAQNVLSRSDTSLFIERTEVLCTKCVAHLGHVFQDGPEPTGLRYCINSAALRFIPS